MYNVIKDELSDKKWPKIIVRNIQCFIYSWWKQSDFHLPNGGDLDIIEYDGMETFFGYYDRSPLSSDFRYLLFYASPHSTKLNPNPNKPIFLVLYNMSANRVEKYWEIWAYNWQQGSKAQWINDRSFVFNNYSVDKGYYSVVYDIDNKTEVMHDIPNYDSCDDFFLSLNFSRLDRYRPDYGYRNIQNYILDDAEDGVFLYSIENKTSKLLISINELKKINPTSTMISSSHKVNHIMLSPNRKQFMFMHRWLYGNQKDDRLYIYNLETNKLSLVSDYGMVSHCYWINDKTIVGYMKGPDNKVGYYIINIVNESITRMPEVVQCYGDGHPSVCDSLMVFDTYPDGNRLKHLLLYDFNTNSLSTIASMKESLGYECQCRCDCHPRFVSENILLFDSTHTGKRQLCVLKNFCR